MAIIEQYLFMNAEQIVTLCLLLRVEMLRTKEIDIIVYLRIKPSKSKSKYCQIAVLSWVTLILYDSPFCHL